jgi:hypothetical protein
MRSTSIFPIDRIFRRRTGMLSRFANHKIRPSIPLTLLIVCTLPLLFISCAQVPSKKDEWLAAGAKAAEASADSAESVIAELYLEIEQSPELAKLAPRHTSQVLELLESAQVSRTADGSTESALATALAAGEALKAAKIAAEQNRTNLQPGLDEFAELHLVGADQFFPMRYDDLVRRWQQLVELGEDGQISGQLRGLEALMRDQRGLEIDSLLYVHVTRAERLIERTEDLDGDKWAKQTFATAEESLERAVAAIRGNPRARESNADLARSAFLSARHAGALTQEALLLERTYDLRLREEEMEMILMYFERQLDNLAVELGITSFRYSPLSEQIPQLEEHARLAKRGTMLSDQEPDHRWLACSGENSRKDSLPSLGAELEPLVTCTSVNPEDLPRLFKPERTKSVTCVKESTTGSNIKRRCD